jgi:hypothetical protein
VGIIGHIEGLIDFDAVQTGLGDSPFGVGQYSEFGAWPSIGIRVQVTMGRVSALESVDFHRPPPPIAPTVSPMTTDAADKGFTLCLAGGHPARTRRQAKTGGSARDCSV